ncbi:type II toxin-antitoxin system Phd/YefM family antitoxin [Patulibacter brassicae]|uniref:Antitoxin n=1 Tax=Patulibacter brassicae TaxID=1705717 RepID=A0ABU4VI43_9ACTN|nr:type II toxin-antitoxin system Phd/YefM family antitoxin [Patulibacter brassicae]MDX8150500.1 type II toxin-antitoxin system Phd/YefM family antitoxin [Patulibacter brassicae]
MSTWQLQEAKQQFSEVVRRTLDEGPQVVTRNGEEVVAVVPIAEWRAAQGTPEEPDLHRWLLDEGPKSDELADAIDAARTDWHDRGPLLEP